MKGEVQGSIRKVQKQRAAANVSGSVQLPDDLRGRGKLRPPGDGLEPVFDLSELWQAARSQEPAVANGISPRGLLEGGSVLSAIPESIPKSALNLPRAHNASVHPRTRLAPASTGGRRHQTG